MEWLTNIAPDLTGWNKFKTAVTGAKAFIREQIEYHKNTFQDGNLRDFMDVFINEMHQTTDPNSSFSGTAGGKFLFFMLSFRACTERILVSRREFVGGSPESVCCRHWDHKVSLECLELLFILSWSKQNLICLCIDDFLNSSTLTWALLYLSRNPSVQKKFQAEIDAVVGRSRLPSLTDKDS